MTPRQQPTEPRESPRMNTSGMLKLFVYGTLKRGYWNHDAFCLGVLEIRDAQVRGRLYEGPGFPLLEVPDEDILARGTADPLADVATQARLSDQMGHAPNRSPKAPQWAPGAPCTGSCSPSTIPESRLPRHRPPGGFPAGRPQSLPARAGPGYGERRLRTRLGLHGRGDSHQATQDRLRPLAEVAANRPQFRSSPRRYIVSPIAPFTCRRI